MALVDRDRVWRDRHARAVGEKQALLDAARAEVDRLAAELREATLEAEREPTPWGEMDDGLMRHLARVAASVDATLFKQVCGPWRAASPVHLAFFGRCAISIVRDIVRTRQDAGAHDTVRRVWDTAHGGDELDIPSGVRDDRVSVCCSQSSGGGAVVAWLEGRAAVVWKRLGGAGARAAFNAPGAMLRKYACVWTSDRVGIAVVYGDPDYWLVDATRETSVTTPMPGVTRVFAVVRDWVVFRRDGNAHEICAYRRPGDVPLAFRLPGEGEWDVDRVFAVGAGAGPARIKVCTQAAIFEIDLDAATMVVRPTLATPRRHGEYCVSDDCDAYAFSSRPHYNSDDSENDDDDEEDDDEPTRVVVVRDGRAIASVPVPTSQGHSPVVLDTTFSADGREVHVVLKKRVFRENINDRDGEYALMTIDLY